MPSTPDKFILEPRDTTSPLYGVKDAWENYELMGRLHRNDLQKTISEFEGTKLAETIRDPSAFEHFTPIHLEARLNSVVPDFVLVSNGLRRALDKLHGSHLAWNTLTRKSSRKMDYQEDSGWVLGSLVGPHPAIGGFAVQLEIADDPEQKKGIYLPFETMVSIRYFDANYFDSNNLA